MLNEYSVLESRYHTILKVSVLLVELEQNHGKVIPEFIKQLESYRIPLLEMVARRDILSPFAKRTLAALNAGIVYAKTGNRAQRKIMIAEYRAGDRICARLVSGVQQWH